MRQHPSAVAGNVVVVQDLDCDVVDRGDLTSGLDRQTSTRASAQESLDRSFHLNSRVHTAQECPPRTSRNTSSGWRDPGQAVTRTVSGNASTGAHDSTCRDNDSSLSNYEELLAAEQRAGTVTAPKRCLSQWPLWAQDRSRPSTRGHLLVIVGASEEDSLRCGTYDSRRAHEIRIRIISAAPRIVHR